MSRVLTIAFPTHVSIMGIGPIRSFRPIANAELDFVHNVPGLCMFWHLTLTVDARARCPSIICSVVDDANINGQDKI